MLAKDIKDYLIAEGIGTSLNIFAGPINEGVTTGIGLFEKAGRAPDKVVNLEFPSLDLLVAGVDKLTAYNLCYDAYMALHQVTDETINAILYKRIEANGSVQYYGNDNNGRFLYIVGFDVIKETEV